MKFNCVFILLCSVASIVLGGVTKNYVSNKIAKPIIPKVGCALMPEMPKIPPGSRVVNGSSTGKPFPYQLQLRRNNRHKCGAVLISPRFALSAHHCVLYDLNKVEVFSLVAGAYTSWDTDKIGQVRTIKNIKQLHHTNGQPQKPKDPDIVIIEVHEPFEMTPFVRPACLPTRKALPGETCIVSGWGNIENGLDTANNRDHNLQAAKLDVIPSDDVSFCKKIWIDHKEKYGTKWYVGEHTLCAFDLHSSPCHGDSGGPLVCGTSGGASIHGIVSFGNPQCETRAEDNEYDKFDPYPTVFVDVYHFIHEIKTFIEGEQPCPVDHHFYKDGFCDKFLNNPDNCFDGGDCCGLDVVCATGSKCECHSSTKRDEM